MIGPAVARLTPELLSIEAWGGATYDVALRFLAEDPWERLAALREADPEHRPADAAARPQHRRLHALPAGRHRRVRRRGGAAPGSTSSGSSTRSTTSTRCGRRSTRSGRPAPRSPRSRSATPATCPTRPRSSTRWTTTCGWPSRSCDAGAHVLAIKDMAGLLRAPAAQTLVTALRRAVRPAAAPAHPRHRRRPAGHLPGRLRRRGRRGGRGQRADGRHHLPAAAVRAGRGDRLHRPANGFAPARRCEDLEPYWEAVRALYAPFESGPAGADRPGLPARDPRRAAVQPAAAGHRARARRPVRGGRGHLRGGQRDARPPGQGHPVVQGGRRPGPAPGRRAGRPGRVRGRPRPVRHPRLGDRVPVRRARRSARRLAGTVPQQGIGRPDVTPRWPAS